ncbi:unnamed protein product [Calypogeia fissa]
MATSEAASKNLRLNNSATAPKPPSSGSQEILIEVITMAANPADYKLSELLWPILSRLLTPKPASPGLDFCGRVVFLPEGSKEEDPGHDPLHQGQLVFGRLDYPYQFGTLGQFIKAPRSGVVPLPDGVDVDHAAAIGTHGVPKLSSIAKILGCHTVVSCSGANAELCQSLGADEIIDYTKCNLSQTLKSSGQVFDLLVDNVSKPHDLYKAANHFLKKKGHFVQVAASDDSLKGVFVMLSRWLLPSFLGGGRHPWRFLQCKNDLNALVQIGQWVKEEKLKVLIDSTFEYEDAPEAYVKLRTFRTRGKIVIHVTDRPQVKS